MVSQHLPGNALTFGTFLKQLRRRAGLTQGELAAAVNLSVAQISRLEQDERLPTLSSVAQEFIPALALQDEPRLARKFIELAAAARGEKPPARLTIKRTSHYVASEAEESISHPQSTLPVLPTRLVGREASLEQASTRLLDGTGRLLTLVGPPGIGKSTLALALALRVEHFFTDGATYVALAALTEPDGVALAILDALDLSGAASGKAPQTQLIEFLRRKHLLLLLDNFEHLIVEAPLVAKLLSACAGLHVLVTSREALRLRGERRFRVPPLEPAAAVELFAERAQAVEPSFELEERNGVEIAQICHQLDHLPLAIELVAARLDLLSPTQILNSLNEDRLHLVGDTSADLPAHQQTLPLAIARSYDLLHEDEQALFRALAVFAGGCSLAAIQAVAGKSELLAQMTALVHKSLVSVQHTGRDEPRFFLLETLRAYAWQQLVQHGEVTTYSRRHADYFMALAGRATQQRFAAGAQWLEELKGELDNLNAALRWLLEEDAPSALRLVVLLHPFWENGGYQLQASRRLQQILAANPSPTQERAYGLLRVGIYAHQRSEYEAATRWLAEAHALFTSLEHLSGVAETLRAQGWLASDMDAGSRTVELFEASLALYRRLDDKAMISMLLSDLVHVLNDPVQEYERARAYADESVVLAQALDLPYALAYAKQQIGINETRRGNYAAAAKAQREALALMRQLNAARDIPWLLELLGEAAWHLGDWAAAEEAWQEALTLFAQRQREYGLMLTYHHLGQVARARGDFKGAAAHYAQSLRRCWEWQELYMVSRCLAGQGGVALGLGDLAVAARLLAVAFRLFAELRPFLAAADQADYEQLRATLAQRMEANAFTAAWAGGEAMNTAEAVALALDLVTK